MLKVKEAIIVEGRYDKNTVSQAVDALIIETDGFGIFKNRDRQNYLRSLAERRGLIVLTDSDGAGFVIRNFIKGCVPRKYIKNAYIPDIEGKEKRKSSPSKEGKLGVEGMSAGVIIDALRRAGATFEGEENRTECSAISKADMYALGLAGKSDSAERRAALQRELGFPAHMTANALMQALNALSTRDEVIKFIESKEYKAASEGLNGSDQ